MDPFQYLTLLKRRWWIVAAVLVVAVAAAFATLPEAPAGGRLPIATSYTATHTLLQSPQAEEAVNLELTQLFATTGEVPRKAAVRLGRPAEEGPLLASQVRVSTDAKIGTFRITLVSGDGERAARIVNAFAVEVKEFLRTSTERERTGEAAALQESLNSLSAKVLDIQRQLRSDPPEAPLLEAQRAAFSSRYQSAFSRLQTLQEAGPASSALETLEEATPTPILAAGSPVPTSRRGRLGLAAALGLLLGVGLVLAIDRLDTRLRSREEIEEATRLPVVAEVPRLDRASARTLGVITASSPASAVAEAYRSLRSSLLLIPSRPVPMGDAPEAYTVPNWQVPQVILVTSAAPGDGKTSTVVNLATTLAEAGRSVVVLDADFRRPAANLYLGVPRAAGLSDLLTSTARGGFDAVIRDTAVPGVRLVTSGTSSRHPAALLARFGVLVAEARKTAEFVIIDSAPLLVANDATDIVPHVDTVLLITRAGRTTEAQAARTSDLLGRLGVPVLGTVVQASREAGGVGSYYSGPGGDYGVEKEKDTTVDDGAVADPRARAAQPVADQPPMSAVRDPSAAPRHLAIGTLDAFASAARPGSQASPVTPTQLVTFRTVPRLDAAHNGSDLAAGIQHDASEIPTHSSTTTEPATPRSAEPHDDGPPAPPSA